MVSIILPTYNRGYIIENAIESVLEQTYKDFELIIVDDGSSDETFQVVSGFDDKRIRYKRLDSNKGGNYARNIALATSEGEYIAFIDSDNTWNNDHLRNRMVMLKGISQPVMSFGRMEMMGERNECSIAIFPDASREKLSDRDKLIKLMMIKNRIDTNTVVVSRDCIGVEKGFDTDFSRFQDWDFFFGLLLDKRNKCIFDDRVSVKHYNLDDSITSKPELYWSNRLRMVKKYKDIIKSYQMERIVEEYLSAEIQGEGNYSFLYQSVLNENDSFMTEYMTRIILSAAEREKRTANMLKKMLQVSDKIKENLISLEKKINGNIVIYGNGYFGRQILDILRVCGISVDYIVDRRNSYHVMDGICYIDSIDGVENAELVIVAMASDADNVAKIVRSKTKALVYTIENLMDSIQGNI